MVELANIVASIRGKVLFRSENLSFQTGELVAFLGKNGSGKSTLLKAMAGLNSLVSGEIRVSGANYFFQKNYFPSQTVSYIPVKIHPFGSISLLDFILSGKSAGRNFMDIPSKAEQAEVMQLLEQFNLQHMALDAFDLLSDGEQKLALIMRSIYRNSEILLLDEPESFLDVGNRKRVFQWLKKLSSQGKTILFSTHQPDLALDYADKFLCIEDKRMFIQDVEQIDKSFSFLY